MPAAPRLSKTNQRGPRVALAFRGSLNIGSGLLTVSDGLGEALLEIPTRAGPTAISIYTDAETEPTEVDVIVTAAG